jgi:hypothetical protein
MKKYIVLGTAVCIILNGMEKEREHKGDDRDRIPRSFSESLPGKSSSPNKNESSPNKNSSPSGKKRNSMNLTSLTSVLNIIKGGSPDEKEKRLPSPESPSKKEREAAEEKKRLALMKIVAAEQQHATCMNEINTELGNMKTHIEMHNTQEAFSCLRTSLNLYDQAVDALTQKFMAEDLKQYIHQAKYLAHKQPQMLKIQEIIDTELVKQKKLDPSVLLLWKK